MDPQRNPDRFSMIEGGAVPFPVAAGAPFLNRVVGFSGIVARNTGHRRMMFFQRETR
jgi:hypothetical protein